MSILKIRLLKIIAPDPEFLNALPIKLEVTLELLISSINSIFVGHAIFAYSQTPSRENLGRKRLLLTLMIDESE